MSRKNSRSKKLLLKKKCEKLRLLKKKEQQRKFLIRSLASKKGWKTRKRKFLIRSLAIKKGWKTRKKKPVVRRKKKKISKTKDFVEIFGDEDEDEDIVEKFVVEPVESVENQYMVFADESANQTDIAELIYKQLQADATIFRFWFKLQISPDYSEGNGSTGFKDLPGLNINTLKRVKQFLNRLPGDVYQWFYFVGKIPNKLYS